MVIKLLIVEDDDQISRILAENFRQQGYEVYQEKDGNYAKKTATNYYFDLIILDVMLQGMSGIDVCKSLRQSGVQTPILMLTALNEVDDRVKGLEYGADDYMGKPFSLKEVTARVNAMLRRNLDRLGEKLVYDELVMDLNSKQVFRGSIEIKLTAKEMALLEYFMRNAGKVLSRAQIAEKVWGINFDTGTNMVDVYVNYLRNKIDKPFNSKMIHTVVGFGYRLDSAKSEQ
jgi:DNA-binding response OmpR family regulator